MAPKRTPLEIRFRQKVARGSATSCWPWTGSRDVNGYGKIGDAVRGTVRAHRLAWEIDRGPIPDDMVILHGCDNPACCNPSHLSVGTLSENTRDMHRKDRGRHRLSGAEIDIVRARLLAGESGSSLARELGVSQQLMSWIKMGNRRTA